MTDIGDEFPVKIKGYPIGWARVVEVQDDMIILKYKGNIVYLPSYCVEELND